MKKATTILTLLLLFSYSYMWGQDNYVIEGRILDDMNQAPVAFANVAVYNPVDSSLVKGSITNDNGEFSIDGLKASNYFIKVSYVGYKNKFLDKISINSTAKKANIGSIGISPTDTELGEVTIKEDKLKGQEKVDRTVYNVTAKIHEVSSSGLDVLKHIPSVSVDFQDNVTLEGNSDILFFVDDVKRDKDFVAQLDPSDIERVEIMTNPSAKYDADVSGIIHIYLKKEKRYGLNGRILASIPSPPNTLMDNSAGLDYGFSNFRIYVSDRMHYESFVGAQEAKTIKTIGNSVDKQLKNGEGGFSWMNNNLNYGVDWFINEKNSLNFYGNYRIFHSKKPNYEFDNKHYIDEALTDWEKIDQDTEEKGSSYYLSLYYKRKFDDAKKELTIQSGYYDYEGRNNNEYSYENLDLVTGVVLDEASRNEYIRNHKNSTNLKIDYTQNFTKSTLELGSKSYYQWYNNKQQIALDAEASKFLFDELRQAAYANYTHKFDKLTMQLGLRTEYAKTNIDNSADNDYFCWLPHFSLKRQLNKSQSIKLNLKRRIYRPGIDDLNPFVTWIDSLHISKGNPSLKPSYKNNLELVYSKNFNSNMISPKLWVNYRTDDFQRVSFINDENITETGIDNIGKSWAYGFSLNYAFKLADWWRLTGFGSLSNTIIYNNDGLAELKDEQEEKVSYKVNANSIITLFKSWNFMMMLNYNSPYISYQRTHSRELLWIVALQKKVFKNGKLQLFYLPPYTKEFTFRKTVTETPELYDSWEGIIKADYLFSIEFSYTFSTGKKVKKLNRSTEIESDGNNSLF